MTTVKYEFQVGDYVEWPYPERELQPYRRGVVAAIVLPGELPVTNSDHPWGPVGRNRSAPQVFEPRPAVSYVTHDDYFSFAFWPPTEDLRSAVMPNAINLRALYGQLEVGLNQRVQDFAAELIEQEFRRFIAGLVKRATLDLEEQYTADIDRAINQAIHDELSKLAEKYK